MWLRTSFVSIILVICLYSCDRRDNSMYSQSLLMLEDSLEAMPEKFLRQILEMDTTSLRESDRAFHYFLLAKAKVLVPHSPELLLDESDGVLSYFANRRDSSRLCQLYYFLGRLYADRYAFLRANASYNQAEKFVGQNIRMLFAIKVGEAYIYRFKMMHGMEEECLKRALNIAGELNDSSLMAEAMHELAELCIFEKNYVGAENRLRQALELLPQGKTVAGAEYNKDLARVYLAMNKLDSALYYTDIALQGGHPYDFEMTCNILKGNIYLKKHCLKEAEHIFLKDVERLSLKEKQEVYYKMSLLKKEEKDFQSACEYAEKSIRYRDSLEVNNKAGYISNLNAFQEHERQQRRIARMNMELSEQELSYYRLAIILSFVLLLGVSVIFHVKQAKKKVEVSLKEKELTMVRLQNNQWVTEVKYLHDHL